MNENSTDPILVRRQKLERIRARGGNPFSNGFVPDSTSQSLRDRFGSLTKEALESNKVPVSVSGRILAMRDFGKAAFVQLHDRTGKTQIYLQKDTLQDLFVRFRDEVEVGDIIGVRGYLFRTKTNELSLHAEEYSLLTKSLSPLPEKFHGLTDIEARYRQRYIDLISNPESRKVFQLRSQIVRGIRKFFDQREYLEVETPMMHPLVGGANARPFMTHHNALDMPLFLRIAPELYLKRLVVGGFDRVYEINRNFRNEGISIKHNPEFTMLEFYQAYATYEDLMPLTEALFQSLADEVLGSRVLPYGDHQVSLDGRWRRLGVEEAIIEYSGFKESSKIRDRSALMEYCVRHAYPVTKSIKTGELQMLVFDHEVEHQLIQPTFITHYPLDVSPLSRRSDSDPYLVDRFELFITGREVANAFSELNDPDDQENRFRDQLLMKEQGNEEACDMDEDYIAALRVGLPPAAGEGIGIDRLVMLFSNSPSIRDVILFPLMKR